MDVIKPLSSESFATGGKTTSTALLSERKVERLRNFKVAGEPHREAGKGLALL